MNAHELIDFLNKNSVQLQVVKGNLRCKAPAGFLTVELLEQLKKNKHEIITLLTGSSTEIQKISNRLTDVIPCSYSQQRLWFIHEYMEEQRTTYSLAAASHLHGNLSISALREAFNALVERHEILRTTFVVLEGNENSEVIQCITPTLILDIPLVVITEESEVSRYLAEQAAYIFNLSCGPLLKVSVLQLHPEHHILSINIHHIITDAWSQGIIIAELQQLYHEKLTQEEARLPELPIQYADYAVWQRVQDLTPHLAYWKNTLADYKDSLNLPYDFPRPPNRAWKAAIYQYHYPKELAQQLTEFSKTQQVTLFITLFMSFFLTPFQ